MSPHDFYNLNLNDKQGLSGYSGMALLNWGFTPSQIRILWSYYSQSHIPSVPVSLLSSEVYQKSGYPLSTTSRYLHYDKNLTSDQRNIKFGISEMLYLRKFPKAALKSWGFSLHLINVIKGTPSSDIPEVPNWLLYTNNYKDSPYTFQNASPTLSSNNSPFYIQYTSLNAIESLLSGSDTAQSLEDPVSNESLEVEVELSSDLAEVEETTISSLTGDTVHDLQVKYQGTYGLYKGVPFILTDVVSKSNSTHGYQICGYTYTSNGSIKESIYSTEILECNMTLPVLGFINNGNTAIFIERKHRKSSPTRYRKGLRADNLIITNVSSSEHKEAYGVSDPYDIYNFGEDRVLQSILSSLFYPIFYTYEEALTSLLSFKKLSCAISSSIALSLDFKTNKVLLHRNQFTIGIFNPKEKAFILKTSLFNHELTKAGVAIK